MRKESVSVLIYATLIPAATGGLPVQKIWVLNQRIDSLIKVLTQSKGPEQRDALLELKKIGKPVLPEAVKILRDETKTEMARNYALGAVCK